MAASGKKMSPSNVGCSHPLRVKIHESVPHVNTGTPLRGTPDGYLIALPDEEPELYSSAYAMGGQEIVGYRAMTIELYEDKFRPGDRVDIHDIDDFGRLTLVRDEAGPYRAAAASQVTLDVVQWLVRKGLNLGTEQVSPVRGENVGEELPELRVQEVTPIPATGVPDGAESSNYLGRARPAVRRSEPVPVAEYPAGGGGDPHVSRPTHPVTRAAGLPSAPIDPEQGHDMLEDTP